MQYVKELTAYV